MTFKGHVARLLLVLTLFVQLLSTLSGCATPIEVKMASKSQLEAIDHLDRAVGELQRTIDRFHQQRLARSRTEGRVLIAQQAIDVALQANQAKTVTADVLFKDYEDQIQPWIDSALLEPTYTTAIERLKNQIANTTDTLLKNRLTLDLQDLQLKKAQLSQKPAAVTEIEGVILADIAQQQKTAASVAKSLDLLRAQLGIMKALASRIDGWISVDVTVSQEQIDGLRQGFAEARQAFMGERQ